MNMDAEAYMREIVDPTINDFAEHQASRRHAFLACVATSHCIDYLEYPKKPGNRRTQFRRENPDFAIVDRVAHAFKHLQTGHPEAPQNLPLQVTHVYERPPGRAGAMQAGLSRLGDPVGSVEIWGENVPSLLGVVRKAAEFLRGKLPAEATRPTHDRIIK